MPASLIPFAPRSAFRPGFATISRPVLARRFRRTRRAAFAQ
ncbi:hypothetical protein [Actinacidiphila sp. ITFR-21]|nr:hypothetical protein [Streptomyces sp. ITFR-21]WNI16446.1 hypothetical protein RLT57_13590 [Streptomyces sp. ITFR-21]